MAPDNGLLTPVLRHETVRQVVALDNVHYWLENQSDTFHGRDLFSPVGAHVAAGVSLSDLGETMAVNECMTLPHPVLEEDPVNGDWIGEVIYTDGFGNLITSFPNPLAKDRDTWSVRVHEHRIDGIKRTFSEVQPGHPVIYTGSAKRLEIGVCNGHAASQLGVKTGDRLRLVKQSNL